MKYLQEMVKPQGWTIEHIRERHFRRQGREINGELIQLIVTDAKSSQLYGTTGFPNLKLENGFVELGLMLHPRAWRKGVCTAIHSLILEYAFEKLKTKGIEWDTHPENIGMRNFVKKIGATVDQNRIPSIMNGEEKIPRVIYTLPVALWPKAKNTIRTMLQSKGRI